jgi:hypothetical protein
MCVDSAEGRLGPPPAPPLALLAQDRPRYRKAHLHTPVGQYLSSRSRSPSVDTSCSRALFCSKDECGIASNAVTVLKPDLVDSVALSTHNLQSHFHPKVDSHGPFHSSGVSPTLHYPPNSPSSLSNIVCFNSSNSLYRSLTTVAASFHSLTLGASGTRELAFLVSRLCYRFGAPDVQPI